MERLRLPLMVAFPILLAMVGFIYYAAEAGHVSTDDAFIRSAKESVNARVSGQVVEIAVRNNQCVQKGQLLFRLDPEPYQIAIERTEALLNGARLQIGQPNPCFRRSRRSECADRAGREQHQNSDRQTGAMIRAALQLASNFVACCALALCCVVRSDAQTPPNDYRPLRAPPDRAEFGRDQL